MICQMQDWHLLPYTPVTPALVERVSHTHTESSCNSHIKTQAEEKDQFLQSLVEGATLPDGAAQERWGMENLPTQISDEHPNARLRWQFLSWPFLQPKEYVMTSYRRASRERSEIALSQDTTQPYVPFNSYHTTRYHTICRCLY